MGPVGFLFTYPLCIQRISVVDCHTPSNSAPQDFARSCQGQSEYRARHLDDLPFSMWQTNCYKQTNEHAWPPHNVPALPWPYATLALMSFSGKRICVIYRHLISQHPEVEAKVLAELEELQLLASPQRPSPRPIEYTDLNRLTYLSCCIKVPALPSAIGLFMFPGPGWRRPD